jgi:hypothetical protein
MQKKMMYLLVSQHISGIIMPIIRRRVQSRQRLWCTALAVLQQNRVEEVVRCALVENFQQVHTEPFLLHKSAAARPVLYTIGVVGFVLFS